MEIQYQNCPVESPITNVETLSAQSSSSSVVTEGSNISILAKRILKKERRKEKRKQKRLNLIANQMQLNNGKISSERFSITHRIGKKIRGLNKIKKPFNCLPSKYVKNATEHQRHFQQFAGRQKSTYKHVIENPFLSSSKAVNIDNIQNITSEYIHSKENHTQYEKLSPVISQKEYDEAVKAGLVVAIISASTGKLFQPQANYITDFLVKKLQDLANNPETEDWHRGPSFRGKPTYRDRALQLWCADKPSVDWLKDQIEDLVLPSGDQLTCVRPDDVLERIRCGIVIPGLYSSEIIGRMLHYQNPWAEIHRWSLISHHVEEERRRTFCIASIPKSLVPLLMEHERRLCFQLGSVYVMFQGKGRKFVKTPPGDAETTTISVIDLSTENDACKTLKTDEEASVFSNDGEASAFSNDGEASMFSNDGESQISTISLISDDEVDKDDEKYEIWL